jgi:hypothetical protein
VTTSHRLLAVLCWLAIAALAWRWFRCARPAPLGPPRPAPVCAAIEEVPGLGVRCVPGVTRGRIAPARLQAWAVPLDLNRATPAELASLDGIGPSLAARISGARPFASVDDVARVRGIGPRRLAGLRPRLYVTGATSPTR